MLTVDDLLWHFCPLGKSLSDDQTSPHHQVSAQSEPGTLEKEAEPSKAAETVSGMKLSSGE